MAVLNRGCVKLEGVNSGSDCRTLNTFLSAQVHLKPYYMSSSLNLFSSSFLDPSGL